MTYKNINNRCWKMEAKAACSHICVFKKVIHILEKEIRKHKPKNIDKGYSRW